MATWDREFDLGARAWTIVALLFGATILAWVILLGSRSREQPARCPHGFTALGPRCCAPGQGVSDGACVGLPTSCPSPHVLVKGDVPGCVLPEKRIRIEGGSVTLGPTDWDSASEVERRTVTVRSFWLDRSEVDSVRYHECERAGLCDPLGAQREPGLPLLGVSAKSAGDFCAFVGGRLPSPAEWLFAAAGPEARRYPWGAHGLVCRRASYGLSKGPCARGAKLPEISGTRPEGATPTGLLDMAGNAEEMTLGQNGDLTFFGGSYLSKSARELKVWTHRKGTVRKDTGFRCAYSGQARARRSATQR